MAYVVKTARSKPSVTTNTTLYTVTAGKHIVVASLRIVNMGSSTETCQIAVAATSTPGATEYIGTYAVEVNKPVQISGDLIEGGKLIVVYNATGGNCVFSLSGWEES